MPELPEVQTTVNGLKKKVVGLKIQSVWTDLAKSTVSRPDYKDSIKYLPFFKSFENATKNQKIISAERQGKNILINLENKKTILIHMKMTGHLLYGMYDYDKNKNSWTPSEKEKNEALRDPYNRFIHFVFSLSSGKHLVFCDTRKFGKITLISTEGANDSKHLSAIGPDPLGKDFVYKIFAERIASKPKGKIKSV